jgi:FG-GAP-like repeat/FG-GAP repeat
MRRSIMAVLGVVFVVSSVHGQYWLKSPIAYENWPGQARLGADLDGDGDVDLIRFDGVPSNGTPPAFRVLLNAGDGQFSDGAIVSLPTQSGQHVVLADVDGDGLQDVVVSTLSSSASGSGLLVFPGVPGAAFSPSIHIPLPGNVVHLSAGNANGDGIADLAVIHGEPPNSSHARWILGNPAHAFTPVAGLLFPSSLIKDLAVLDLDANGIDDFAMAHGSTIYFFFTDGGSSPSLAGPFFPIASDYSTYLAAADLDGNGDLDLVAASTTGFGSPPLLLSRLLNDRGSWTQLASQSFPGASLGPIFLGDWDGNGAPDLFLHDSGSSGVNYGLYENDGTGTFTHRYTRATLLPGGGGAGLFELNGDSKLDFADSKAVYFGDGTFQDFLGTPGQFHRRIRDWEGDGDLDLAFEQGEILKNDGRAVFTTTLLGWPVPAPNHFFSSELFYDDLDGDGLVDGIVSHVVQVFPLTYQFLEMRRFEDTGAGSFVDLGPCAPAGVEMVTSPLVDDVDGDGDLDLINSQGIWFNDGTQFFGAPTSGPFQPYQPILKGDVDGDGDVDFIAAPYGAVQSLALLRRTAPGVLSLEVIYSQATSSMLNNAPVMADLDDDGDLDIAVDNGPSSTTPTIYANTGGVFAQALIFPVIGTLGQTTLAAGDFDGDGNTDLALGYSRRVRIYRRLGPGLVYDAPRTFVSGFGAARGFVDVDDDGDVDLMGSGNTIFNPRFDGAAAGFRRQYGTGVAGTGGRRPVLGKSGPLRVGYTATMRVREGLGGASGVLVVGLAEANLPDYAGLTGLTLYVDPIILTMPVQLSGPTGVAGVGSLDLPFYLSPAFGGLHAFVQAGFGDPGAPNGISTTNGLEESIGF